ncbi:hypothetical protein [Chryseobacterium sp. c4a]|uniref:hypothetical protein n=1 Tax=Chryseobacterium sp. c4a TaxID=1573582 RepID=UPI00135B12BF|nr:hypothetical protein [Chryseobacterium sp. c4a]
MKIQILAFLAAFLFCISCNNDDSTLQEKTASYDVYLGGVDEFKACYWKNGQQTFVQGGENLMGTKIIVDNNDVYLFGTNVDKIDPKPAWYFWKNGVKHNVAEYLNAGADDEFAIYSDMIVHNGDIYFLGKATNPSSTSSQDKYQYCYWKNGIKTVLETYGSGSSVRLSGGIEVFNNIVYTSIRKNIDLSNYPTVTWDLGYYNNNTYYTLFNTDKLLPHKFINDPSNPSQIYMITKTNAYTLSISSIKNITSGNDIQIPANIAQNGISQVYFEGSDKYYIGKDFYYKNNTLVSINNANGFNDIGQFTVKDQNIYTTRYNPNQTSVKFYINDVETQSLPNIMRGCFNSIFVVKK